MLKELPLFPVQASTSASEVDNLYFFLIAVSVFFSALIFIGVIVFAVKYRRRSPYEIPQPIEGSWFLESLWTVIPLLISLVIFVWGAKVYFDNAVPPKNALEIFVVGKQWMWKLQHPEGNREINELHVPIGQAVKLTMTSEDVIHSFFIPEFRVKRDVVPGRYNSIWFLATKPGTYRIFCSQYCGTQHSAMIGHVYAMTPDDYQNWLAGGGDLSMAKRGEALFQQLGCSSCHNLDGQGRCPNLRGVFGSNVLLRGGGQVLANESYIRESILFPEAKVVAGFEPIMPTFQGLVNEEGLLQLIAYIRTLSAPRPAAGAAAAPGAATPAGTPPLTSPPRGRTITNQGVTR
jgi:cytochrome c oxidase subunit 2